MVFDALEHPIVQAPMGGGPSTVALAAAVCEAGGLGFLATGYRKPEDVRAEVAELRGRTDRPFGVNLFVPREDALDEQALRTYVQALGADAGAPHWSDDAWEEKLALVRNERPAVVSFTFGCPPREVLDSLPAETWVTVTSAAEARTARDAGADVLVLQGVEAGGHQGSFTDADDAEGLSTLALLRLVAAEVDLPLVAAGAIADGPALAAVLAAGASAAQIGTAFMLADEAGTHPAHREAIASERPTGLTRAFTGRTARGIQNRFMREHRDAPVAYPHLHYATAPIRAAARERGDAEQINLWAGQTHRLAKPKPAAEIVRELSDGAREALQRASDRL